MGTHLYSSPGVYTVTLTVTDSTGRSASVQRQVAVYDPTAGFVTGSGWIMSPPVAYRPQPAVVGRANFASVSQYKKGASTPSGTTTFLFEAAGLLFASSTYDWMVVAGQRAQYRGTGQIAGRQGDVKFTLTAIDHRTSAGRDSDRFRIRLWTVDPTSSTEQLIYDNQVDPTGEGAALEGTLITGGSIQIHK